MTISFRVHLQIELAKPLIALLQRGYHERQAALRPNVPQVLPSLPSQVLVPTSSTPESEFQ